MLLKDLGWWAMLLKTFGCGYTMYALVQVVVHKLSRNPCKGHLRAVRVDSNGDERVVELENCRSILDLLTWPNGKVELGKASEKQCNKLPWNNNINLSSSFYLSFNFLSFCFSVKFLFMHFFHWPNEILFFWRLPLQEIRKFTDLTAWLGSGQNGHSSVGFISRGRRGPSSPIPQPGHCLHLTSLVRTMLMRCIS